MDKYEKAAVDYDRSEIARLKEIESSNMDKCSWSLDQTNYDELWWVVSCRLSEDFITLFSPDDITYCPYCGKEIKHG